jgi:hypothetical protein
VDDSTGKVVHFINIACWYHFFESFKNSDTTRSAIFCDSISMRILCGFFGIRNLDYRTGSSEIETIYKAMGGKEMTVLSPFYIPFFGDDQIVLEKELVDFDYVTSNISGSIAFNHNVFIGISSPKQNLLAMKLAQLRPDLKIYCLGAVIATFKDIEQVDRMSRKSNTGFEWLFHLKRDPSRFFNKIRLMSVALLKILFKDREKFSMFGSQLEKRH